MKGASSFPLLVTFVLIFTCIFGGFFFLVRAYNNSPDRTAYRRDQARKQVIDKLKTQLESYKQEQGAYPTEITTIYEPTELEDIRYKQTNEESYSLCIALESKTTYCVTN